MPPLAQGLARLSRPTSPMRSSHRVGPVGSLGSHASNGGISRWDPRVLSFAKDEAAEAKARTTPKKQDDVTTLQVNVDMVEPLLRRGKVKRVETPSGAELASRKHVVVQARASDQRLMMHLLSKCDALPLAGELPPRRLPRTVELEPQAAYNHISFHVPPRRPALERSPVRLFKFDHTPGATVYEGLFDPFEMPTGEQCFFYHHSDIVCEALDPGPYPRPDVPDELDKILQTKMPDAPQAPAPEGRDGHPAVYVPLHHHCPPIRRHAIPLCALTGIFGGIPSEPMHILARQADEVVEEEAAPVVVEKHEWQLPESIFGPRAKESDSRTFWDTQKTKARCLETDWARLLKEQRFWKFIEKNDDDIKSSGQDASAELNEIKAVFVKRYGTFLRVFD